MRIMSDADRLRTRISDLMEKLRDVHRIKGRDLQQALARARRLLPRAVRKRAAQVLAAQPLLGNAQLERTLDFPSLHADIDAICAHLDEVDVVEIRRRRMLGMFGLMAFYILFIAGSFLFWMVKSGQL